MAKRQAKEKGLTLKPYVTSKGGVVILNGPFPMAEAEKVKSLCAAAPDLLAACKVLGQAVDHLATVTSQIPYFLDVLQMASDAIAKAEGR